MPIKSLNRLFLEKYIQKIVPLTSSLESLGNEIESAGYLKVFKEYKNRVIPHVDYSKPENFAKYGSAERYYIDAIENIYKSYPYDGSLKEKLQWHLTSSYLENYIFENEYPRTNGYIYLTGSTYTNNHGTVWGRPHTHEHIYISGSINKGNVYNSAKGQTDNLTFDLTADGATVEFWMKKRPRP